MRAVGRPSAQAALGDMAERVAVGTFDWEVVPVGTLAVVLAVCIVARIAQDTATRPAVLVHIVRGMAARFADHTRLHDGGDGVGGEDSSCANSTVGIEWVKRE